DAEVAEHLKQCRACAEYFMRIGFDDAALANVLSAQPSDENYRRHEANLANGLNRFERRRFWQRSAWVSTAAAAMLAICAYAAYSYSRPASENVAQQSDKVVPANNGEDALSARVAK